MTFRFSLVLLAILCALVTSVDAADVLELIGHGDQLLRAEENFPDAFEEALALYRQASKQEPQAALPYLRIANVCLSLGDGVKDRGLAWYQQGEQAAQKAVALQDDNADAHFLVAANRGNVVNLLPFWKVSPGVIAELEQHLLRALALEPRHARANHMLGMLLYRTPGPLRLLLNGKHEQVESYLVRAVEADPNFAEARFDLAQFYQETGRPTQARIQAQAILTLSHPVPRRDWIQKYRPRAEQLLKNLPSQ